MPVRHLLEDIRAEPFPEFHHALLMTQRPEVAALQKLPELTDGRKERIFKGGVFLLFR